MFYFHDKLSCRALASFARYACDPSPLAFFRKPRLGAIPFEGFCPQLEMKRNKIVTFC